MDTAISDALDELIEAKQSVVETVSMIRENCNHDVVAELPFYSTDFGDCFYPRRICYKCRLEETTKRATEFRTSKGVGCDLQLYDTDERVVEIIKNKDDFYSLRLPNYLGV